MTQVTIEIVFPEDRRRYGILSLIGADGARLAGPFEAYGKADNAKAAREGNRERNPIYEWGDTPAGEYLVERIAKTGDATDYPARSFGPDAGIFIDPVSGPALSAKENGRIGLCIHSGEPSRNGGLRPTFGCVRLSNEDMRTLLDAMSAVSDTRDPLEIRTSAFRVSIRAAAEGASARASETVSA